MKVKDNVIYITLERRTRFLQKKGYGPNEARTLAVRHALRIDKKKPKFKEEPQII